MVGVIVFVILLIMMFINIRSKGFSSKYSKYKTFSTIFIVLGLISMTIFGFLALNNKRNRMSMASGSSTTADGFTIEKYDVVLDVDEEDSIKVKEYITVNFYESGHHGILKFIPSWLEYTNKNRVTESREAKIINLRSSTHEYRLDTIKGKDRIKMGNPIFTLSPGTYTYEIDYTYDMGFDPYEGFDEFIFHTFGDYWGTEIKNASVTVNLPKSFDSKNKIKFFEDKYRRKEITNFVDYSVNGNTIYAKVSPNYKLYKSLTVDIELPDNYFKNSSNNYGSNSLSFCLICIIVAVISFILWNKKGKDLDKVPETVEFYPPDNLDAAEIGYLYKKDTGRKLAIALIVELASKGYIKIIESEDKKTQTIVKTNGTDINKYINREIKIVKLKDYKIPTFNTHEKATQIMSNYFKDGITEDVVTSDFDTFYEDSKYLVKNGYIKIVSDTLNNYTQNQIDQIQNELNVKEIKDKPEMSANEKIVYDRLFENGDETILSENHTFYKAFNEVGVNLRNTCDDKVNDLISYRIMLITSILFLMCTIIWALAYCVVEDLNPRLKSIYTIAFIANIITLIFTILMKRKNSYGEEITAKINGFKNYIELAEKNQLEMLVEQNPNYFYNILPYAYVLDISKVWIKKFENIPMPSNDMGNFDYYSTSSLDGLSDSVYLPSSSSSGGGCSSCGGGCSSCGGGCSSCGGGGSW